MMGRVSFPVRYNEGFAGKVPGQDLAHFPSVNTWDISWSNRGPLYRREKSVANSATDRPNQCDEASTLFTGRQALHRRDARILLRGIDQKVNGLFLASAEGSPRCPILWDTSQLSMGDIASVFPVIRRQHVFM